MTAASTREKEVVQRYELHAKLGSGGMATVHLARFHGAIGFARAVAIKRIHRHLANDPTVAASFINEAKTASRVVHPNVVRLLDVVANDGELLLVLEYVLGESLSGALASCSRQDANVPLPVISRILCDVLEGLHAAHEAVDEDGEPLELIHRDVSPQNILLGADGIARVLDFGIAKALADTTNKRDPSTRDGILKGKISYLAPEQVSGARPDRRVDVYAAGVMLWEALTGCRLFAGKTPGAVIADIASRDVPAPSTIRDEVSPELDAIALRAIERHRDLRFATAREMAIALEAACPPAMARDVASWLDGVAGETIRARVKLVREMEIASPVTERAEVETEGNNEEPTISVSSIAAPAAATGDDEEATTTVTPLTPLSPLSVSPRPAPVAVRAGRRRIAITMLIGVSAVVVGGVGISRGCGSTNEAAERVTTTESLIVDPEPERIELPATPPSATASSVRSPAPHAKPRSRLPRSAPCANPFRVDEHGVRIPRPECF